MKLDVVALQESHITPESEVFFQQLWRGKVVFSHGSSNSRGVAILFKKSLPVTILGTFEDWIGRVVGCHCKIDQTEYFFVNIYSPGKIQDDLSDSIFDCLEKFPCPNVFILGDGIFTYLLLYNCHQYDTPLQSENYAWCRNGSLFLRGILDM